MGSPIENLFAFLRGASVLFEVKNFCVLKILNRAKELHSILHRQQFEGRIKFLSIYLIVLFSHPLLSQNYSVS